MNLTQLSIREKTNILLGLFVGSLIAANLIGLKIADFGIFEASVGILFFPILFLITDIIEEVHGKKKTQEIVLIGFIVLLFVLIITAIAVFALPHTPRSCVFFIDGEFVDFKVGYDAIFGTTMRIFIASLTAFLVAQFHDIWAFNFWKQKTKGRFLWLRNNLSTLVSTFIDTMLFMYIAFYAISPKFTAEYVFSIAVPYWLVKVLFALFDTPFCYVGVRWLKGPGKNKKTSKSKS